ncbi:MAG: hypothetical protein HQK58_03950 [Deltaproteobacteria bacterium]|nr:hypothetical protein [Deltaproteobacteria bacterium]
MKESIGRNLSGVLTKGQLVQLLDTVFRLLDEESTKAVLADLGADVSTKVTQVLYAEPEELKKPTHQENVVGVWSNLWDDFGKVLPKVGHASNEPDDKDELHITSQVLGYTDSSQFISDMNKVAKKMLPLLKIIHDRKEEKENLFWDALKNIEDRIRSNPDSKMAAEGPRNVGWAFTECLIKWTWLSAPGAEAFLNRMVQVTSESELVDLDEKTVFDFFFSLSEDEQRQIYDYLSRQANDPVWKEYLRPGTSIWSQIYQNYSKIFDHAVYIQVCRDLFHQNWHYGPPLISHAVQKDDFAEADRIYEQTMAGVIGLESGRVWRPEEDLLMAGARVDQAQVKETIHDLLTGWIGAAERLGHISRAHALKLQLVTYQHPTDWDRFSEEVEQVDRAAVSNLIEQWKKVVLEATLGSGFKSMEESSDCWIKWLIDAGLDQDKNADWFCDKTTTWITSLTNGTQDLTKERALLFILTRDLAAQGDLKNMFSNLLRIVERGPHGRAVHDKSRRVWLKRLSGDHFITPLTNFWAKNVVKFIPNPGGEHKSDYTTHAMWLAATKELDPISFQRIIDQWKNDYKLRRNLWKAIGEGGIPLR